MEKIYQLPGNSTIPTRNRRLSWLTYSLVSLIGLIWVIPRCCLHTKSSLEREKPLFEHLETHCSSVQPIEASEFHARQLALAKLLHKNRAAAYIAEPGPNAHYFANLSLSQWWLSERPFLLVIIPEIIEEEASKEGKDGTTDSEISVVVKPRVIIVTPRFEESRARLLDIPTDGTVTFTAWPEDSDPYATAVSVLQETSNTVGKIFVDEGARYFIAEGIKRAANGADFPNLAEVRVETPPPQIRALRERKSPAELSLLRCANEATLLALREVQKHMHIGIYESEARALVHSALSSVGLKDGYGLVLFGENAALPHGSGTNRQLGEEDLALFDMGGSLHGYYSDLTRTIALPKSRIPPKNLQLWYTVLAAQTAALGVAEKGTPASEVDSAARFVIDAMGAGDYFTHRLGHGIGLQVHESPYLRGGNDVPLAKGNVFSNEPGIYIEGEVGVRLEDCFAIDESGEAQLLTAGVGGQAQSPWQP